MPPKIRELKAQLRRAGFASRPGKGSHTVWEHPDLPEDEVSLAGSDGSDAKPYQIKAVRQLLEELQDTQEEQR
jgi:predicted RNA binding protein YcfA (HicA-like mRNA interferase family)